MPSQLTRHVFRRLLANEPIIHSECLRRQRNYSLLVQTRSSRVGARRQDGVLQIKKHVLPQKRTFLNNIFGDPKQHRKEALMDPGIDIMMDLVKRQSMSARLPSRLKVREAIVQFIMAKYAQKGKVEDTQADLLLPSLKYVYEDESLCDSVTMRKRFPLPELLEIILPPPGRMCDAHVEIVRTIHEQKLWSTGVMHPSRLLNYMCRALCGTGKPEQARKLLVQYLLHGDVTEIEPFQGARTDDLQQDDGSSPQDMPEHKAHKKGEITQNKYLRRAWRAVAKTFAEQGNETELLTTRAMTKEVNGDALWNFEMMLLCYITQNDSTKVERAWNEYWNQCTNRDSTRLVDAPVSKLLNWCVKEQLLELGHQVVRDLLTITPTKAVWDVILRWAVSTGKSVDEVGRMIEVMEDIGQNGTESRAPLKADIATFNILVGAAISKDDPYMAERFISLGKDRGIQPDAKTLLLQMDYRLTVHDVDGALTAYKHLQAYETPVVDHDDDAIAVNKLIVALCDSKVHDFDTIMNVAADLSDRRAHFEPLTVSKLTLLHLSRDEIPDVIDLLNTHAFQYSLAERESIRDTLISCSIDPETPAARAWDGYMICREIFDELPRGPRVRIMSAFFGRKRADIAVHIFNHMRAHTRADTIPDISTYISAFNGIAKIRDFGSLELIHNQLKLDFNINLNTHIRNVLIAAYTACGRPRQGLAFWDDIVASREGPSYKSIHLALRACERSPAGDRKAQEIWTQLRSRSVQLDSALWASYVAALIGNGDVRLAISTLEEADEKGELDVDAFVLGSMFMGAPGREFQEEVELWATERYPQLWTELEKTGGRKFENGSRAFGIDRTIAPIDGGD